LDVFDFEAPPLVNGLAQPKAQQRAERRFHHVGSVLGTKGLAQHVLDTGRFENGAHRLAGDNPGAG
jgi:hypothetical protein